MDYPGEKLLIKLWETIAEKGIGSLLKPWQIRREGRALIDVRCAERIALAETERDAELIMRGYHPRSSNHPRIASDPDLSRESGHAPAPAVEQHAMETLIADTIRSEVNVARALLHAEEMLESDSQTPPDEKVETDWLFRWRDSASQISREELQDLWGRLLAGEVKAPGSYSLRTLGFLKNLSQQDAEAIAKLSQFVVQGAIYNGANAILEAQGVSVDFLLDMQQLGLIVGVDSGGLSKILESTDSSKYSLCLTGTSMALVLEGDDPNATFTLPGYKLTAIGSEVLTLGTFDTNVEYLKRVGVHFKLQGLSVEIGRYVDTTATTVRVLDAQQI